MRCLIISDTTTHSKYWYYKYVQLLGGENILSPPPTFHIGGGGRRPSSPPPHFLRLCLSLAHSVSFLLPIAIFQNRFVSPLNRHIHVGPICPFFKHSRTRYLKPYFYTRPSSYKLGKLFCSSSKKPILNLSKLANIIFKQF